MVLDEMVEKGNPLLDAVPCFSQLQSNFTSLAKIAPLHQFFDFRGPNEEEERIFWLAH